MIERLDNEELKQDIDRYLAGQLSASEVDELWAELIRDERYLDYMKSAANMEAVVQRQQQVRESRQKRSYFYYAAAAVIVLVVALLGVMNFYTQSPGGTIDPVSDVEIGYYRSADGTLTAGDGSEAVRKAITLANTGNTAQAIEILKAELKHADDASYKTELNMTLGSLYYNSQRYDEAVQHFSWIINHKDQLNPDVLALEKAYWYRGNAYLQHNDVAKAESDIRHAYELNGAYRRVAERYLKALE